MGFSDSTTWLVVGASALMVLLVLAAVVVLLRRSGKAPTATGDVRARSELQWLHRLAGAGASGSLDSVLRQALEAAADLADAGAAIVLLSQPGGEPLTAALGLTAEETARQLPGLPPGGADARAVALAYRYTEEELARDDFRLTGGLALALTDPDGGQIGTLAVFWRRLEREATEEQIGRLESLAAALGPAVANARRFEALRREADLDEETDLNGRRSLERFLAREYARARRYEHPLTILMLRHDAASSEGLRRWAADRLTSFVRASDMVFHVGGGRFATLLPEASRGDGERLAARLERALTATLAGGVRAPASTALAELRDDDDAVSLLARAEEELARNGDGPDATDPRRTAVDRGP